MNPKATLITAVAVCSFTGFLIGRISSQSGSSSSGEGVGGGFRSKREAPGSVVRPRASGSSRGRDRGLSSGSPDSRDTLARLRAIFGNPDALERAESWLRFMNGLSPSEIKDVVINFHNKKFHKYLGPFQSDYGSLLCSEKESSYQMLLELWVERDLMGALDYMSENKSDTNLKHTIFATWAISDPLAAIKWAENNHDGDGSNPWMEAVIEGITASDPQRATELLNANPGSINIYRATLHRLADQYSKQFPEKARAWALNFEDEQIRKNAIDDIASLQARSDPWGTADWLIANSGTPKVMSSCLEGMIETDAQAAVSYFEGISDVLYKKYAFSGIISKMASTDPRAALSFFDSHPSLNNEEILKDLIQSAGRTDPIFGVTTISRLQDDEDKRLEYYNYLRAWTKQDVSEASAWMNQNRNLLHETVIEAIEIIQEKTR